MKCDTLNNNILIQIWSYDMYNIFFLNNFIKKMSAEIKETVILSSKIYIYFQVIWELIKKLQQHSLILIKVCLSCNYIFKISETY